MWVWRTALESARYPPCRLYWQTRAALGSAPPVVFGLAGARVMPLVCHAGLPAGTPTRRASCSRPLLGFAGVVSRG